MTKFPLVLLAAGLCVWPAGQVAAFGPGAQPPPPVTIIASDLFDTYATAPLGGQGTNGFGWASGWVTGAVSTVTVNSGATVVYAVPAGGGLIGGGRSVTIAGSGTGIPVTRGLSSPQTGTVYLGFVLEVGGNPNTGDTYALYLNNSAADTVNGVNVGLRGNPTAGAYFFVAKGITAPASGTPTANSGSITDTRYLVLKLEKTAAGNYNKATAWINPGTNSETARPNGDMQLIQDLGIDTFSQVLVRASGVDAGDACSFDSLTLAQTFADLMRPARPGPDTSALVARVQVEAAANGSANAPLPAQTLAPGASVTSYAIVRSSNGTFVSNSPMVWSLVNVTGAVLTRDLVVSSDRKSATFKANGAGTAQILAVGNASTVLASDVITVTAKTNLNALGRPFIWSRMSERDAILSRLDNNGVAAAQFLLLKNRADAASAAARDSYLRGLPLTTTNGSPKFTQTTTTANDTTLLARLNEGVDCAVMYHLTGDTKYARCASDVLHNSVIAYRAVTPFPDPMNGGWIYSNGLLGEAAVAGMQLPVIYDYLYDYLKATNLVYQLQTTGGTNVIYSAVDFTNAQTVFRTFYQLTRDRGLANCNWSPEMAQTLVPNALALDDVTERNESLKDYLTRDNPRQTSLKTDALQYPNPGDIWPESLDYSEAVNTIHPFLMTMLDRYDPALNLFTLYPNVAQSMARPFQLVYPDGKQIHFGDFHGDDDPQPYFEYEVVYRHAVARNLSALRSTYGPLINAGVAARKYNRAGYVIGNALPLLWYADDVTESASAITFPRTDVLPHAGIALQRNPAPSNNTLNGLMCFVGGAAHVHSHANGMNLELYGQGTVLGAEGGRGDYGSALHENYYRLYAAHNTIIVNGASRGEGGWADIAINTVQVAGMEPGPSLAAVSPDVSFTCTTFVDDKGTAAEATQQRTLAIVRTSSTTGYYVDLFRSKSTVTNRVATTLTGNVTNQYHDYIYHNLGDTLAFTTNGVALTQLAQTNRFKNDIGDAYQQPGWRYFSNTVVSTPHSQPVRAQFTAELAGGTTYMDVHLPAVTNREYAKADAPGIIIAPGPETQPAPVMAIRQIGEAWNRPFVLVFEPHKGTATSGTVTNVTTLEKNGIVVGLKIESRVAGSNLVHYVLSNPGPTDTYTNAALGLAFTGRFAVVTDRGAGAFTLYLGEGSSLTYQGMRVSSQSGTNTAANVRFATGQAPVVTANSPVDITQAGAPTMSDIADQTVSLNGATAALPFTVGDDLTPPGSLLMTGTSSNTNLVPNSNIVFGGSGANRTVTVTPASEQFGTATIQLVVSDGALATTNSFLLSVTVDPALDRDGDGMTDLNEWAAGRNPTTAADLAFEFNTDGVFEGWGSFNNITNTAVTNGALSGASSTADPNFSRTGFAFAGNSVSNIVVKFRFPMTNLPEMFWGRAGSNSFSSVRRVTGVYSASNAWQVVVFPVGNHNEWKNQTINGLRIDPGARSNQVFEIDWVRAADSYVSNPSLGAISNQTVNLNTSTGPLPFTINDDLTPPAQLTVSATSSNTNVVPHANLVLAGTDANRTVTVTPASNQLGTTTIQLVISDGTLTATNSFTITVLSVNTAPVLAVPSTRTITAGQTLVVTNVASDTNLPAQTLTFSLISPPAGAVIHATNGVVTWRPTFAQSPSTNPVSVKVTDNGIPILSATQSFNVVVLRPATPTLSSMAYSNGVFRLTIQGDAGPDYTVQTSTNLVTWFPLWTNTTPAPPFLFADSNANTFTRRFYRILIGP